MIELPVHTPTFPPITLDPVLVTLDPARTANASAVARLLLNDVVAYRLDRGPTNTTKKSLDMFIVPPIIMV